MNGLLGALLLTFSDSIPLSNLKDRVSLAEKIELIEPYLPVALSHQ